MNWKNEIEKLVTKKIISRRMITAVILTSNCSLNREESLMNSYKKGVEFFTTD